MLSIFLDTCRLLTHYVFFRTGRPILNFRHAAKLSRSVLVFAPTNLIDLPMELHVLRYENKYGLSWCLFPWGGKP